MFCPRCGYKVSSENHFYSCWYCNNKWYSTDHLDRADKTLDDIFAEIEESFEDYDYGGENA